MNTYLPARVVWFIVLAIIGTVQASINGETKVFQCISKSPYRYGRCGSAVRDSRPWLIGGSLFDEYHRSNPNEYSESAWNIIGFNWQGIMVLKEQQTPWLVEHARVVSLEISHTTWGIYGVKWNYDWGTSGMFGTTKDTPSVVELQPGEYIKKASQMRHVCVRSCIYPVRVVCLISADARALRTSRRRSSGGESHR